MNRSIVLAIPLILVAASLGSSQTSPTAARLRTDPIHRLRASGSDGTNRLAGGLVPADASARRRVVGAFAQLPLSFEQGGAGFVSRGADYAIEIDRTGTGLKVRSGAAGSIGSVGIRFEGARGTAVAEPREKLPGMINYMIGRDRTRWRRDIPTFASVRSSEIYPGIDVVYYGNQRRLEYDFVVAPGADPRNISLAFSTGETHSAAVGRNLVRIDRHGNLVVGSGRAEFLQQRPVVYQTIGGERRTVSGRYVKTGPGRVGIRVGRYDRSQPLVIDPVLSFATFLGTETVGTSIALDRAGNAYIAGSTISNQNPQAGLPYTAGVDAFVAKLSADGKTLLLFSHIGGGGDDLAGSIALDKDDNVYLIGQTLSSDFPTTASALQIDHNLAAIASSADSGSTWHPSDYGVITEPIHSFAVSKKNKNDVFVGRGSGVSKSTDGGESWRNLVGLPDAEYLSLLVDPINPQLVYAAALDSGLFKSVNGGINWTRIDGTPFGSFQPDHLLVDPNDPATVYATNYFGSSIFVTTDRGNSWTSVDAGLPKTSLMSPLAIGANSDLYVAHDDGSIYKSTNNGVKWDQVGTAAPNIYSLAVDPSDPFNLFVAGPFGVQKSTDGGVSWSGSSNGLGGKGMTHVVFNPALPTTLYTFSGIDPFGLYRSIDGGKVWKSVGDTATLRSPNAIAFVALDPQVVLIGSSANEYTYSDAFIARLDPTGSDLQYATYLGGTDGDYGTAAAIDAGGNLYVLGGTSSTDLPVRNALLPVLPDQQGAGCVFVAKIDPSLSGPNGLLYLTYFGGAGEVQPSALGLDQSGKIFITGTVYGNQLPVTPGAYQGTGESGPNAFMTKLDPGVAGAAGLLYSTYFGGNAIDLAGSLLVERSGNRVLLSGATSSTNIPATPTAEQAQNAGGYDAYIVAIDLTKTGPAALDYATYLGGTGDEGAFSLSYGRSGAIYVAGSTTSMDFPVTANAEQSTSGGGTDLFLARFNPSSAVERYRSYFGGNADEGSNAVRMAVRSSGGSGSGVDDIYLLSESQSTNLRTTPGAYQPAKGGELTAILAKFQETSSGIAERDRTGMLGLHSYPDPVTSTATVRFVLPAPAHVRLELFDAAGRHVAVLADDRFDSGEQSVPVDARALSAGHYHCRLLTGGKAEAIDFVVVK